MLFYNKYTNALLKLQNGDYIEAYQEFSHLIKKNKNDLMARYYRGVISYLHLDDKIDEAIKDLEASTQSIKPIKNRSYVLLCDLYATINDFDKTIHYGSMAIKTDVVGCNTYISLARAYFYKNDINDHFQIALDYIDESLQKFDDEIAIHLEFKLEILYELGEFKKALDIVEELFKITEPSHKLYYYKGMMLFELAKTNKEYIEAYDNFEIALKYIPNDVNTLLNQIAILRYIDKEKEALELYDEYFEKTKNIDFLAHKLKFLYEKEEYNNLINEAKEKLNNKYNLEIYELVTFSYLKIASTLKEIEEVLLHLLIIDDMKDDSNISMTIIRILFLLSDDEKLENYLMRLINKRPNIDLGYYFLSLLYQKQRKGYNLIYQNSLKTFKIDKCNCNRLIYTIMYLQTKPDKVRIGKLISKYHDHIEPRFLSSVYLYGSCGVKSNFNLAFFYCENVYKHNSEHPYFMCWFGRVLELTKKDYQEAFKLYELSYLKIKEEFISDLEIVYAYYAHSYLSGIGTIKDVNKAKSIIKEGIVKFGRENINLLAYLYAYLALLKEDGFDLDEAYDYLEIARSDAIYNVLLEYYQLRILEEKNDFKNIKIANRKLKRALKYDVEMACNYYNNHKDEKLFYPLLIER